VDSFDPGFPGFWMCILSLCKDGIWNKVYRRAAWKKAVGDKGLFEAEEEYCGGSACQ
jgi:hypothetical protein